MIDVRTLEADRQWLSRLAFRLVQNQADADDVVQETLVAATQSPPQEAIARRSWLKKIATNVVRMSYRSNRRRLVREESAHYISQSEPMGIQAVVQHNATSDPSCLTEQ